MVGYVRFIIFSIEMVALEATCIGAAKAPQPSQPKICLLSRHHSQDMPAACSSSNVITKNMMYVE